MEKLAIFGATGHVGATLVQELLAEGRYQVRPIIRSSGNAWDLARQGIKLWQADLENFDEVLAAIKGCDYVVNCARTMGKSSRRCTSNLLKASAQEGVSRFVHLSSIAVYGEFPTPDCVSEGAKPRALKDSYGWQKLQQDHLVEQASRRGLPCVVLCPPNITGPNSYYLLEVLNAIRSGSLALVDGGSHVCELVDVKNLTHAIKLSLHADRAADGKRIFVTDNADTHWRDVVDALREVVDEEIPELSVITEQEALRIHQREATELSMLAVLRRTLFSSHARQLAQQNPFALRLYATSKDLVERFPIPWTRRISARMRGRGPVHKQGPASCFSGRLAAHQLRKVRHSCQRAHDLLGYQPPVRFAQSMDVFCDWYRRTHGFGSSDWSLLRELYPPRNVFANS